MIVKPHPHGFATYDGRGRFFSAYFWGLGPHVLFLSLQDTELSGKKDNRQVVNAFTGMTDRFWRV